MDQYRCKSCGNLKSHGVNHPGFVQKKFGSRYSKSRPEESVKNVDVINDKYGENLNDSSEDLKQYGDLGSVSSDVYTQKQVRSKVSDLIHANPDEECEMFFGESNRLFSHKNNRNYMDSLEKVISNTLSGNNNISGTTNSDINPDLCPGCNNLKNEPDGIIDEQISALAHSQAYNDKNVCSNVKEFHHSTGDDNAVAGQSGMCRKKKFPCSLCLKKFSWKYDLKNHYRTHTVDDRFTCDICKKRLSSKGAFDRHYRTHTGETPYACDKCGIKFARMESVSRHYRSHTGDMPFVCDACEKVFAESDDLKKRFRSHTGEKPYKCPVCEMAFQSSSSCCRHRRKKH